MHSRAVALFGEQEIPIGDFTALEFVAGQHVA